MKQKCVIAPKHMKALEKTANEEIKRLQNVFKNSGIFDQINKVQEIVKRVSENYQSLQNLTIPYRETHLDADIVRGFTRREIIDVTENEESVQIEIYLNSNGIISSGLNNKETQINNQRAEIIKKLSLNNSYLDTDTLFKKCSYSTKPSLRKAIERTNSILKTQLNLKNKFILGKTGYGYMINPFYLIKLVK